MSFSYSFNFVYKIMTYLSFFAFSVGNKDTKRNIRKLNYQCWNKMVKFKIWTKSDTHFFEIMAFLFNKFDLCNNISIPANNPLKAKTRKSSTFKIIIILNRKNINNLGIMCQSFKRNHSTANVTFNKKKTFLGKNCWN